MAKVWQDKRLLLWVGVCLVVGTAIRLANLFHLGFVFDTTETQHTWAMFANQMGLFNFWKNYAGPFDYAPGSLLLLMGIKAVASWFSQSAVAFVAGIKLLNWAADMSIAWCAYWLARRSGNPQRGIMVAALVYILPSLWFVSSVWGQIDSPVMAMVLWSVVLLHDGVSRAQPGKFWQNRVFWSGVLWAIAYWIKMQAVLILPVFILIYLSQQARTKVRWHITGILAVCVPMLVVFMTNPIRLVVVMAGIFGRSNDIAGGSATFWPLIGVTGTADHSIIAGLGLSVNHLALVIYGVVMLFVLAKIYGVQMTLQKSFRKHMQDWHDKLLELPNLSKIILVMTLSSAVYYLFFPKMHERYLHPAIVFGLVALALHSPRRWSRLFSFSIIAMNIGYAINVYGVYYWWQQSAKYWVQNNQPAWVFQLYPLLHFDLTQVASLLNLAGLAGMLLCLLSARSASSLKD